MRTAAADSPGRALPGQFSPAAELTSRRTAATSAGADPQGIAANAPRPEQLPDRRGLAALACFSSSASASRSTCGGYRSRWWSSSLRRRLTASWPRSATRDTSRSTCAAPKGGRARPGLGTFKGIVVLAADFSDRLGRGETAPIQVHRGWQRPQYRWTRARITSRACGRTGLTRKSVSRDAWWTGPRPHRPWRPSRASGSTPSRQPVCPASRRRRDRPDLDRHAAHVAGRGPRMGARHDGSPAGDPDHAGELLAGKIVPYFVLGMGAMGLSVAVTVFGFGVPFRGSILALVAISSAYPGRDAGAGPADLDAGEEPVRRQPGGLIAGFMPAFELSGFIFEIDSMPLPIRLLDLGIAATLFRLEPADALPRGRRAERARPQRPGARGDGGRAVRRALVPWRTSGCGCE